MTPVSLVVRLEQFDRPLITYLQVSTVKIIPVSPPEKPLLDAREDLTIERSQCFVFDVLNCSFNDTVLLRSSTGNSQVTRLVGVQEFLERVYLTVTACTEL